MTKLTRMTRVTGGLYWGVLGCTELHWAVLGRTGGPGGPGGPGGQSGKDNQPR